MTSGKARRWLRILFGMVLTLVAVGVFFLMLAWTSMGTTPDEAARKGFAASRQWNGESFLNPQPMWGDTENTYKQLFRDNPHSTPAKDELKFVQTDVRQFDKPSDLRVTWFGHSSVLLEVNHSKVLIDPVWSDRVSPLNFIGPERWFAPPVDVESLPDVDVVLISHDHYDHLDRGTIVRLKETNALFVAPLGVGSHLRSWGIPPDRIRELDWWSNTTVKNLTITATPSRHHSGRLNPQSDHTLWAGYAIAGPSKRVFYSGDTGMHDTFKDIGERLGPFDLALVETGQYSSAWPDWHLGPEQAILATKMVNARLTMPIHWALFKLSDHTWTEPAVRAMAAAECQNQPIIVPPPGMTVDLVSSTYSIAKWWPDLPTRTAKEYPIIPTFKGDPRKRYAEPLCVTPLAA